MARNCLKKVKNKVVENTEYFNSKENSRNKIILGEIFYLKYNIGAIDIANI